MESGVFGKREDALRPREAEPRLRVTLLITAALALLQ
jgi:hypothetical protein